MECDSKLRLLYIEHMLKNTDEQHPLTIQEISDYLEINYGISSHRTTIPADIALLQKAGMEIEIIASRPKKFYLNDYARPFSSSELRLLLDTVSSSKFITKQKSEELIQKLLSLSGPSDLSRLKRNLFTEGRLKQENEKIYYIIEAVNDAINLNTLHAITFSSGIGFIDQLLQLFKSAEIIFGCENVMSYSLQEIMAFQNGVIERIRKQSSLKDHILSKIDSGELKLYVAKAQISHEKIYLLSAENGRKRVVTGSANMSFN